MLEKSNHDSKSERLVNMSGSRKFCVRPALTDVGEVEPRFEVREAGEYVREQEVQQAPELVKVVLQRRARQQQLVLRGDRFEFPDQLAVEVLQPVALVHDHVLEAVVLQEDAVPHEDLVGSDDHGELLGDGARGHARRPDL